MSNGKKSDVLAVILLAEGNGLYPITSAQLPTALLPAGSRTLLDGILSICEGADLTEALIITPKSLEGALASFCRARKSRGDNGEVENANVVKTEIHSYADGLLKGTAEVLNHAHTQNWLKTSFILLPPDLCILSTPDAPNILQRMIDIHRRQSNLVTATFYEVGEIPKKAKNKRAFVLDQAQSTLLDVKTDLSDGIELRPSLLRKYSRATVRTDLAQSHVYVCSPRVLSLINVLPQIRNFEDHLLPFLAKVQWQEGLLSKYVQEKSIDPKKHQQALALSFSSTQKPQTRGSAVSVARPQTNRPTMRSLSTTLGSVLVREQAEMDIASQGLLLDCKSQILAETHCGFCIWNKADGFITRASTIEAYSEAVRVVLGQIAQSADKKAVPTQSNRQAGNDSIIGANTTLGEKSFVKKSALGKNVTIGKQSTVTNSILMEGVVIGDQVKLDGCILAAQARVGDGAQLTKCEVASRFEVFAKVTAKNEQFTPHPDDIESA